MSAATLPSRNPSLGAAPAVSPAPGANPSVHVAHRPAFVHKDGYRFLIMDAPTDENLPAYIEECKKHQVSTIVRACEPTYSTKLLGEAKIQLVELPFPDGDSPPDEIVNRWLELCKKEFAKNDGSTMAVHCVAGLGRAPVLVVIALVELGMDPLDAIKFVRSKRRGAINSKQVKFLEKYKRRTDLNKKCLIM